MDVLRFPRLKESDRDSMVEDWNTHLWSVMPTRKQYRVQIGKSLILIKWAKGHGEFRRYFNQQEYEFGFRSAEKYMKLALEHYQKPNTNISSLLPKTDEVHEATKQKKIYFNRTQCSFVLYDLTDEEMQRLRDLGKSDERVLAESAVIKALQPWLKGERVAHRTA